MSESICEEVFKRENKDSNKAANDANPTKKKKGEKRGNFVKIQILKTDEKELKREIPGEHIDPNSYLHHFPHCHKALSSWTANKKNVENLMNIWRAQWR